MRNIMEHIISFFLMSLAVVVLLIMIHTIITCDDIYIKYYDSANKKDLETCIKSNIGHKEDYNEYGCKLQLGKCVKLLDRR